MTAFSQCSVVKMKGYIYTSLVKLSNYQKNATDLKLAQTCIHFKGALETYLNQIKSPLSVVVAPGEITSVPPEFTAFLESDRGFCILTLYTHKTWSSFDPTMFFLPLVEIFGSV